MTQAEVENLILMGKTIWVIDDNTVYHLHPELYSFDNFTDKTFDVTERKENGQCMRFQYSQVKTLDEATMFVKQHTQTNRNQPETTTKNVFSIKIKQLRKDNKFTQKFVADKIGLSKRQYAYLEYGHFTCDYCHIIRLCKLYNVSADDLFGINKKLVFPEI